ncbi:hypothetical protein D3C81_1804160 [compost metagenome]
MCNQNNGLALSNEPLHNRHQLRNFLWRKHSGRLVEYKYIRTAVQGLHNLYPLLHADRNVMNFGIWIDLKAILLR